MPIVVWCENTGLIVISAVVSCRLLVFLTSNYSHHLASPRQKAGQSRNTLPDGFTLVKTCTVPPHGASWILGALRLQAKLCGISDQVGAPEVQCAWPIGVWLCSGTY